MANHSDGRSRDGPTFGCHEMRRIPTNVAPDGLLDWLRLHFEMRYQMRQWVEYALVGAVFTVFLGWLPAAGADEPGPAERAGKSIDHAAKSTEKALKKAGEKTAEGIETAGKAVQKAGKKTGEAVGSAVERTGRALTHAGEKIRPTNDYK